MPNQWETDNFYHQVNEENYIACWLSRLVELVRCVLRTLRGVSIGQDMSLCPLTLHMDQGHFTDR